MVFVTICSNIISSPIRRPRVLQALPFQEKIGYILNLLFQGSSYLSPNAYGILHKAHHSYSDTKKDPHSPNQHPTPVSMMLHTAKEYMDIYNNKHQLNSVFTSHVSEWKAFDNFASSSPVRVLFGALYFCFYYYFAPHWAYFLLLPVHFLMEADSRPDSQLVWTQIWISQQRDARLIH